MNKDLTKHEWFEWAKQELRNLDKAKSEIIQKLAEALEVDSLRNDIRRNIEGTCRFGVCFARLC